MKTYTPAQEEIMAYLDNPSPSDQYVVLNIQYMQDKNTRALVLAGHVVLAAATAMFIYEIVIKLVKDDNYFIQHNYLFIANTVIASLCLAALLGTSIAYAIRIHAAIKSGKTWLSRQKKVTAAVAAQLFLQLTNATFYLAPNVYIFMHDCAWTLVPVNVFGYIRWSCWFSIFFLLLVTAHNLVPARFILRHPLMKPLTWAFGKGWRPPQVTDGLMGYDLPPWVHLPLLLVFWLPGQVLALILLLWLTGKIGDRPTCTSILEPGCHPPNAQLDLPCQDWGWKCRLSPNAQQYYLGLSVSIAGLVVIMLLLYFVFMHIAGRELAKLPYSKYRVPNLAVKFQVQLHSYSMAMFILCVAWMWWVDIGTCSTYIIGWFGMTPMQMSMSAICVLAAITAMPIEPTPRQRLLHERLQQVVWMESELGHSLGKGGSRKQDAVASSPGMEGPADKGLACEEAEEAGEVPPMYCFETALKSLYWSNWIYYHLEEDSPWTLDTALGLFNLQHHDLLWERKRTDTKCIMAWGEGMIVIGFRGTASMANVLSDIKVWRHVHPPERGVYWLQTQPMVHKGFLEAFTVDNLNVTIANKVQSIIMGGDGSGSGSGKVGAVDDVAAAEGDTKGGGCRRWRVLCVGHSLGGALATLCAYDMARQAERLGALGQEVQVQLYTFGAPRPGNHAFARDFIKVVPDSWDTVHANDAVAKEGKLLWMYKRAANRVLITGTGDILPRPSFLEHRLHRGPGSSIKKHLLTCYAGSFASVIRGQFKNKASSAASKEALRVLASCQYVQDLLGNLLSFRQISLLGLRSGNLERLPTEAAAEPGASQAEVGDMEQGELIGAQQQQRRRQRRQQQQGEGEEGEEGKSERREMADYLEDDYLEAEELSLDDGEVEGVDDLAQGDRHIATGRLMRSFGRRFRDV